MFAARLGALAPAGVSAQEAIKPFAKVPCSDALASVICKVLPNGLACAGGGGTKVNVVTGDDVHMPVSLDVELEPSPFTGPGARALLLLLGTEGNSASSCSLALRLAALSPGGVFASGPIKLFLETPFSDALASVICKVLPNGLACAGSDGTKLNVVAGDDAYMPVSLGVEIEPSPFTGPVARTLLLLLGTEGNCASSCSLAVRLAALSPAGVFASESIKLFLETPSSDALASTV